MLNVMIEKLIDIDKELFLFLNSKNNLYLDPLMLALSSYELWWIIFVLLGILIYFNATKQNRIKSISFYGGSVLFATAFTNLLKLIVQRPRPIHEKTWIGIIHNIEEFSSASSFFSSHAATTFCIAIFTFLFFRKKRYIGYLAILWALGVSYSRIYVGKHYPLDVFVGMLFGLFVGYLGYNILNRISEKKITSSKNKS